MSNLIVLGAQWGDEGKGKIVDLLSEKFDAVARYQGGHNAGHTVFIGDRKFVLKLIPSGILRPGVLAVIGNGIVIDPAALLDEIAGLEAVGVDVQSQLKISNRAHIIFPFHRTIEKLSEGRDNRVPIGTTSRGIGPCYEDKIARRGIRIADLVDNNFESLYRSLAEDKKLIAEAFQIAEPGDFDEIFACYQRYAEQIRPMACDTSHLLNKMIRDGKSVLFEGAQGTMLDIDFGTYPFVTSSSAAAGGACTGTGVPPNKIDGILGVSKAYITRVGAGPFPSEDHTEAGEKIRRAGNEYGSVTGRPRRCGWFDVPLLRYTAEVNGFDSLIITKLDVLDELPEIPVCVAYEVAGEVITHMPASTRRMEAIRPIFERLPGWKKSTQGVSRIEQLPTEAQRYLKFLEEKTGVEIGSVSNGPERNETMIIAGSKLERLLAK
ncbi:MAG: adenylosuccinate synthase [Acidobacteriota bacterium]|nr:adenylosuccinate synthase [Acidobacteriota bacterium]